MKSALGLILLALASACNDAKDVAVAPAASGGPVPASTTDAAPLSPPPAPAPSAAAAPAQIAAQHILIAFRGAERAPPSITRTKAQAKTRAAEVDAKAKAGADFSALVAEYSDDPAPKERMGSLGKFARDKMDKAFSDAAFQLKVDEVSDVVETRFGFHVIKRNQ